MNKKLMILIVVLFSFIFIDNISAKKCKYNTVQAIYQSNSHTDFSACERNVDVYGKACEIHNSGDLLKAEITLNFSTDKISITYPTFKNSTGDAFLTRKLDNVDVANSVSAGPIFHTGDTCPKWILVRTGANSLIISAGQAKGYYEFTKDEAYNDVKSFISSGKWSLQSFFFIGEKIEDSTTDEDENKYTSCKQYTTAADCEGNSEFSCMWVVKNIGDRQYEYCNFDDLTYVKCGDAWDIPSRVPGLVSFLVNLLKIVTPIILILVSIISLVKATASSREDEIKKAQSSLIRKLIAAAIVFFVIQITQFVILKVADSSEKNNFSTCLSCMLNNDCTKNIYYKTNIGPINECTPLVGTFDGECH